MPRQKPRRATFGSVRKLPSGRFQARYTGPDGGKYTARHNDDSGPLTFETRSAAQEWLSLRQSEITRNAWASPGAPKAAPEIFKSYAEAWIMNRDLEVRSREQYEQLLRNHIVPTFGDTPVEDIAATSVRVWHAELAKKKVGPTARANAYGLLRAIMHTAVADDVMAANPCRVRGAGQVKRSKRIEPATLAELEVLTKAMPEKLQVLILLAAWCGLRFGELTELRRSDVDTDTGVIRVRRGVVKTKAGRLVKGPKSEAGKRPVNIPPHLWPAVTDHIRDHATKGWDGLLFPAARDPRQQLGTTTVYRWFYRARDAAGRPDLCFHHLRHTGAVLAASTGATLAELMARLGHSTPAAAMLYQHAAADRDKVIAAAMSELVKPATVTPIRREAR